MKNKAGAMWVVQTGDCSGGWENVWSDGSGNPVRFCSRREAVVALDEMLRDVGAAVRRGDMLDGYDREAYRVVRVG